MNGELQRLHLHISIDRSIVHSRSVLSNYISESTKSPEEHKEKAYNANRNERVDLYCVSLNSHNRSVTTKFYIENMEIAKAGMSALPMNGSSCNRLAQYSKTLRTRQILNIRVVVAIIASSACSANSVTNMLHEVAGAIQHDSPCCGGMRFNVPI